MLNAPLRRIHDYAQRAGGGGFEVLRHKSPVCLLLKKNGYLKSGVEFPILIYIFLYPLNSSRNTFFKRNLWFKPCIFYQVGHIKCFVRHIYDTRLYLTESQLYIWIRNPTNF